MRRIPGLLAAAAAMVLASTSQAHAAPTARQKLATVQYLVGSWSCTHTVGTFSGTYSTTYAKPLGDLWLEQTYDFPPKQMGDNEQAVHGEFFIGYEERRSAWVRFGAMSNGQYFANRMTETGGGNWSWIYVGFFGWHTPDKSGSDATFTKKSNVEYVIDGPTYPKDGTGELVTEHHVCKKL